MKMQRSAFVGSLLFAILLAAFCCAGAAALEERELRARFNGWMRDNQRSYDSEDFARRYAVWRDNHEFVERHNADETQTYKVALNEYADMTAQEFALQYSFGLLTDDLVNASSPLPVMETSQAVSASIPASFDWRQQGAVTAVKNQGSCGACWAFSVTGSIEGAWKIAGQGLVSLSDQQLLDCTTGNLGCNGGYIDGTMRWVLQNGGGMNSAAAYPYTAVRGSCRYNRNANVATIKAFEAVARGSESDLLAKAYKGPVAVGINASPRGFQLYSSGVYTDSSCTAAGINHAVLIVGWGTENGRDYWLVKNEWGTNWGAAGYIKMARNNNNQCGIASMAYRTCTTSDCKVPAVTVASPSPAPPAAPSPSPSTNNNNQCWCQCPCRQ